MDEELLRGFEEGTLRRFSHEDHVRVAFLLVRRYGGEQAPDRMIAGLKGLARNFGTPAFLLHVTRTVAWIRIIEGLSGSAQTSDELLTGHPELLRRNLLHEYYGPLRLLGRRARRTFVEPDLRPFPRVAGSTASAGAPSA